MTRGTSGFPDWVKVRRRETAWAETEGMRTLGIPEERIARIEAIDAEHGRDTPQEVKIGPW